MKIIDKIAARRSDAYGNAPATIVFLGDSVTQGCFECYSIGTDSLDTIYDSASAYSTRVKEIFSLLYPSAQLNIINSGISGDSTGGALSRIDRDVFAYNPDLVVVSFGLNDACQGMEALDGYKSRMDEIVRRVMEHGAECIILTQNMMNTKTSPHLKEPLFIHLSKSFAHVQELGVLDAYFDAAREVAKKYGASVCDLYPVWKLMSEKGVDTTELLANKLNHPVREFHYYMAMKLVETMFGL